MSVQHTDVASYSLGLLQDEDRQAFEAHLAECESCTEELAEFAAMADLFSGVEPVEAPQEGPAETAIADLIRKRDAAQRRRDRQRAVLAVAASLVLLAGGAAAANAIRPHQSATTAIAGQRHSAVDPGTGVSATVGLVSKPWGTQVTLDLARVRGPLECQLIAVSATGKRRVVGEWKVPRAGYGVPGHPGHLLIDASTAIPKGQLASLAVTVVHGRTLVSIPVHRA